MHIIYICTYGIHGVFGMGSSAFGFDMNIYCSGSPATIFARVGSGGLCRMA